MELDTYRTKAFFEVAKVRNFSQAARNLGITQSALSQRIAKLEDELETTLFIRNPKEVRLTTSGEQLLRYCHAQKSLEEEYLSSMDSSSESLKGVVRIAGYSSVVRSLIVPAMAGFFHDHPGVQLEVLSRETQELPALLYSGEVDFLVYNSLIEKNELEALQLGFEENVHIESDRFSQRRKTYLDHDQNDSTTHDYFREQGKQEKLIRSFFDDVYGIIDGVRLGYGRAIVSKHLLRDQKGVRILSSKKKVKNAVVLHYFKRPYYSILHKRVIEELKRNVPQLLRF